MIALFGLTAAILIVLVIVLLVVLRVPKTTTLPPELSSRLQQLHEQGMLLQTHMSKQLMESFGTLRGQVFGTLNQNATMIDKQLRQLTEQTEQKLREISGQVDKRLSDGFEKTTATFHDVIKRLALIDEAQKKITELSTNVVGLQHILADKRSRGAFGEVQLNSLVANILPASSYALQHTLSNGMRTDCILFVPEPTGNLCIDSKFPLESYRRMSSIDIGDMERQQATRQFKIDLKKHINDVSKKYIIPGETADGVVLFIPAEAIFAEIHGHHPDLVEEAQRQHVWLSSPTTLMAILTTIRAVLKDDATRQQIHVIQEHLRGLHQDFGRWRDRMDALAKHVQQAHKDVEDINVSTRKISSRFEKIDKVELPYEQAP